MTRFIIDKLVPVAVILAVFIGTGCTSKTDSCPKLQNSGNKRVVESCLQYGLDSIERGELLEARNALDIVLEADPRNADALSNRISILIKLDEKPLAVRDMRLLMRIWNIRKEPNNAELYYKRGLQFARVQQHVSAAAELERAVSLDHTNKEYISALEESQKFLKTPGWKPIFTKEDLKNAPPLPPRNTD